MTIVEILETICYAIGTLMIIGLGIYMLIDVISMRDKKPKMYQYMVVYQKRELQPYERKEWKHIEFAKTEQKAKEAALLELSGSLDFKKATVYCIHSGCIIKIAEFWAQEPIEQNEEDDFTED